MSTIIGVVAWVGLGCFVIAMFRVGDVDGDDDLNHLDRPVDVQANRVLYASADAWPDHVLN
jgi:hypothetical protein